MPTDTPSPDPKDEALNALALLCGSLIRVMRRNGAMTDADMEQILAPMEAARASPLVTHLLDQVRWAAEWTKGASEG